MYDKEIVLQLLQYALLIESNDDDFFNQHKYWQIEWEEVYLFFREHSMTAFLSNIIKYIPEDNMGIKTAWKEDVYTNIYSYARLLKRQKHILDSLLTHKIPTVVVKGTSAAKYYPNPQLRTMGDIDLLVKPECYNNAIQCLMDIGCEETTGVADIRSGRHRSFSYKDTSIDLHCVYSSKVNRDKASTIDNLVFNAIPDNGTVLPDDINGIALLTHIGHHMEEGLGLRQIIDWFMFVRACLDDEMWFFSFQEKARSTGLEALAITVTRMCQIHLGLTTENITWCRDADETVCNELMQYVLDCGNFGRSREMLQSSAVEKLPSIKHPIQLFKYIQSHGEKNWKALKKHPWLKPFAWIYQSCRYIKLAIQNKVTPNKLKAIYDEGNKRNEMFAALGLK